MCSSCFYGNLFPNHPHEILVMLARASIELKSRDKATKRYNERYIVSIYAVLLLNICLKINNLSL
jgi:uncharacterized membrane protein